MNGILTVMGMLDLVWAVPEPSRIDFYLYPDESVPC